MKNFKLLIANRYTLTIFLGTIIFIAMFIFATPYVNGTDQYWHINSIESILNGNLHSNELYPSFVLEDTWNGNLTEFIHNMPVLYIWALFSNMAGDLYHGAMIFNCLCAILAAFFIYLTVKNQTNKKYGVIAYFTILFFPLTFWQSIQLLTECSALLFLTAAIFLISKKQLAGYLLAAVLLALCANSRTNVLLVAILILVLACRNIFATGSLTKKSAAIWSVSLFALFGTCYIVLGSIFGSTLDFTVSRTIMDRLAVVSTFTQQTNMALHFSTLHFSDIGFGTMVSNFLFKLWDAFRSQFSFSGYISLMFWAQNILFFIAAVLLILQKKKEKQSIVRSSGFWMLVTVMVSWVISSTIYQNQFRYSLIYVPVLVTVICSAMFHIGWSGIKKATVLVVTAIFIMAVVDGGLSYVARTDAISEHAEYSALHEKLDKEIPEDANVAGISLPWSQLLYPRVTTVIDLQYGYTDEQTKTLLLGRYTPNRYLVTSHAVLFTNGAYSKIIGQHFKMIYSDQDLDIYELSGS